MGHNRIMVFAVVDMRNYPRVDVDRTVDLTIDGQTHPVKVRDLSAGGARLESAPLAEGTAVTLEFDSLRVAGVTVRSHNGSVGVRFLRPVHRRLLVA